MQEMRCKQLQVHTKLLCKVVMQESELVKYRSYASEGYQVGLGKL